MMDDGWQIKNNLVGSGCSLHLPIEIEVNIKKTKFFIWKYMDWTLIYKEWETLYIFSFLIMLQTGFTAQANILRSKFLILQNIRIVFSEIPLFLGHSNMMIYHSITEQLA
jgi:hypothetical protein